jgi:IS4 transposase
VSYCDPDTGKRLVFLTNNLDLPARTIADLYKCRWQIELFFKWIKQNLSIRSFFGTSENAVRTQIWIAVSIYVLIAILKKRLKLDASLSAILQTLSVTLFEKIPLDQLLGNLQDADENCANANQLKLQLD